MSDQPTLVSLPERPATCARCGGPLIRKHPRGTYCSARCRLEAWVVQKAPALAHEAPSGALTQPSGQSGAIRGCGPRRKRDLQAEFLAWLDTEAGQAVYVEVLRRALAQREAGNRRGSVSDIYGEIRRERPDMDLNDRYTSRLARLLMEGYPTLADPPFFELRKLRAA